MFREVLALLVRGTLASPKDHSGTAGVGSSRRGRVLQSIVMGAMAWWSMQPGWAVDQTQTLNLSYGWNAVWLEVEPRGTNGNLLTADRVFTPPEGSPFTIDLVAVESSALGTEEFSTDPSRLYNQAGWIVWSRNPPSGEPRSILVRGNAAYLVHVVSSSGTSTDGAPVSGGLGITGKVDFHRPTWNPGGYTLVGFSVRDNPTFLSLLGAAGFSAAPTPAGSPIQRLNPQTGHWEGIGSDEAVETGRAYWISIPLTGSRARYGGPVAVDFPGAQLGVMDFGASPPTVPVPNPSGSAVPLRLSTQELTTSSLERPGNASHAVTLKDLGAASDQDLRLFRVVRVPDQLAWQTDGNGPIANASLATLAPGASQTFTLGVDRNWTQGEIYRERLYRIEVSLGQGTVGYYLPVLAVNPDLYPANKPVGDAPGFAGLWMGEVRIQSVTSLTETNRPVRPTRSLAALRVLIHVNTNGTPVLLSKVMRMQTKSADPSVPAEEVLVLDESQIPFYEGIVERGGKKVGVRYETATFDMPRNNGTNAQSATFLQGVANSVQPPVAVGAVTDADVCTYLAGQSTRPPSLTEAYHLSWPLEGTFGPANRIGTSTNSPLRLDAFHRTNPFRHAYHPQHGAGYDLSRSITVQLDGIYQSGSGRLEGAYEEVTRGLATIPLVSRGRISLQRVSLVPTLR